MGNNNKNSANLENKVANLESKSKVANLESKSNEKHDSQSPEEIFDNVKDFFKSLKFAYKERISKMHFY